MTDYTQNYLQAIRNPLPLLKKTFKAEFAFLKNHCKQQAVLDVGCGAGRPTIALARHSRHMTGIEGDPKLVLICRKKGKGVDGLSIKCVNFFTLRPKPSFDVSFSTYNTLGSLPSDISTKEGEKRMVQFVRQMARFTKKSGKIINITWKRSKTTTRFLQKYYPSIGIGIRKINHQRTVTDLGTFERLSRAEITRIYHKAGLKKLSFHDIGPLWIAAVGIKN